MGKVNISLDYSEAIKLRTILSVKLDAAMESRTDFLNAELPIPDWMENDIKQFTRILESVDYAIYNAE